MRDSESQPIEGENKASHANGLHAGHRKNLSKPDWPRQSVVIIGPSLRHSALSIILSTILVLMFDKFIPTFQAPEF